MRKPAGQQVQTSFRDHTPSDVVHRNPRIVIHDFLYAFLVATGERQDALGQNPRGTVVYTPQRVTFLITKHNRARPEQLPPSDEEKIALFDTMFAYSGTYTVESDRVVHHVDLSWNEAWSGTDQVRFCEVDEQTLTYLRPLPRTRSTDARLSTR